MSTVISVENLGKKYTLHHQQRESYRALRDVLTNGVASIGQKLLHPFRRSSAAQQVHEEFWALKDVSFEVKQGDRIGIIGRNGAGKSTLLKILSRITEPTTGKVKIRGRVASLLEVGTGFHPELTGRENIYLNGAILGMSRVEIKKKFDEIVDFAEIEKFLDTPVKRYSSGMYVRLAFAVAAHLEPEILVVDEVLAVGDAQFQKKCLGKMGEVAQGGRTVLFVSHNMAAMQALCSSCLLLNNGRLIEIGLPKLIITHYLDSQRTATNVDIGERTDRHGNGAVRIVTLNVMNRENKGPITCSSGLRIVIEYSSTIIFSKPRIMVGIYDENSTGIYGLDSDLTRDLPEFLPNHAKIICTTGSLGITPGVCSLNIAIFSGGDMTDYIQNAVNIFIEPDNFFGTGRIANREWVLGMVHHTWTVNHLSKR